MVDMFLRFYDVIPARIQECMDAMRNLGYSFEYQVDPLPFAYPSAGHPYVSKEVNITFATPEARSAFRVDARAMALYRAFGSSYDPSVVELIDLTPEAPNR